MIELIHRDPPASGSGARIKGHQRVDAEKERYTLIERDRRVKGFIQRSVDIVLAFDFNRWKQPRQCRRGLDRLGDRYVRRPGAAESYRRAGVQVRCDQKKAASQVAEVVGASGACEQLAQKRIDGPLIEDAGRHGAPQHGKGFHQAAMPRLAQVFEHRLAKQARNRQRSQQEFAEGGTQKQRRRERCVGAIVDEQTVHLRWRNAVGERGGDKTAGRYPDIHVEVVEVDAVEGFGEREQRAHLVNSPQRSAAGEGETNARTGSFIASRVRTTRGRCPS